MTDREFLDLFHDRWEEATDADRPAIEDLCNERPDLIPQFREELKLLGAFDVEFGEGREADTADPQELEIAGRFELEGVHDRGGLGLIYVARDTALDRRIVIKVPQKHARRIPAAKQQFEHEASITGQLEHPGVVPVYGLGRDEQGNPFYAMRFIRGETLGDAISRYHQDRNDSVAFQKLLRHFLAVCHTIAFAHSRGIIHRDLKPSNIMLGKYGEVLVVDWGLAKKVDTSSPTDETVSEDSLWPVLPGDVVHSSPGSVKGSPAYMSPEQASGDVDSVGPASDLYNLGATFFHLLTGRKPIEGKSAIEVIEKVKAGDFPRPSEIFAEVPKALEAICLRAMQKDPDARYPSAENFANDIERWLADEPVSAWSEPLSVRARRWIRKHRTAVTGAVAALLVGAIGLGALAAQQSWANDALSTKNDQLDEANTELDEKNGQLKISVLAEQAATKEAKDQRDEADKQKGIAQKKAAAEKLAKEKAERLVYLAQIRLAYREYLSNNLRQARMVLEQCDKKQRGWEWRYLRGLMPKRHDRWSQWASRAISQSSDGRILAAGSIPNNVQLSLRKPDGEYLAIPRTLGFGATGLQLVGIEVSPDGKYVAAVGTTFSIYGRKPSRIRVWTVAEQKMICDLPVKCSAICFLPDSKTIAYATSKLGIETIPGKPTAARPKTTYDLRLHDVTRNKEVAKLPLAKEVEAITVSADGKYLATGSNKSFLVWDLKTRQKLLGLPADQLVTRLKFSPGGGRIAVGQRDGKIEVWNIQALLKRSLEDRRVRTLMGHRNRITGLDFSPDGRKLLSASMDRTVKLWSLRSWDELTTYRGHEDGVVGAFFQDKGRRILSGSQGGYVRTWNAGEDSDALTRPGYTAAISQDGKLIATAYWTKDGKKKAVVLWNRAGKELRRLLVGEHIYDIKFSRDGKLVAAASGAGLHVWSTATGKTQRHIEVKRGYATHVAFSPDGKTVVGAVPGSSLDGTPDQVVFWNIATGKRTLNFVTLGACQRIEFNPNGRSVAIATRMRLSLVDALTGKTIMQHLGPMRGVCFSTDGKRMLAGSEKLIANAYLRMWNLETGKIEFMIDDVSHDVGACALTPDGSKIVFATLDGAIRLWDIETNQELMRIRHAENAARMRTARFDSRGTILVTSSGDYLRGGFTRIWRGVEDEE